MRRFLKAPVLFTAGLALFLAGCAGDSPTSPTSTSPTPTGTCNVTISLAAATVTPLAGTFTTVRATVQRSGVTVPDGTSITFVTDLGFFNENGLPSVVKIVQNGFADVSPGSLNAGIAHVKAMFDCAVVTINLQFQPIPDTGPFISAISPTTGTCAGGDTITLDGGRLGTDATTTRVTFGGSAGSIVSVTNTEIKVKTPARTLANPQIPEVVDIVVTIGATTAGAVNVTKTKAFTYVCIDPSKRMSISSINPTAGSQSGGDTVVVSGVNFGSNIATTRVTFCGIAAQILSQQDNAITVTTPRHINANPAVSEVCDVAVTTDLGLVSQQAFALPNAFTYRGAGGTGGCNTDPGFFVASLTPNTGPPDGGTVVTILGGGFGTNVLNIRVDFGGTPGQITSVTNTTITVSTPKRTLANPDVPETVDVTVTDLGSPTQRCAKLVSAFQYTRVALQPVIFSNSPKTGPNDASTRVTIFGNNFQFPMQIFFVPPQGGPVEATLVNPVQLDQLVVLAPQATGPNIGLANKIVDITVINPTTGKTANCPGCFRYYPCPSVTGSSPASAPYTQQTTVTINGANFEEPLTATYLTGSNSFALNVTSVSASAVVVTMPPLATILQGTPASIGCANVSGTITLNFLSLACSPVTATFTYRVDPPSMTSASPNSFNQDGSSFGSPLGSAQATITALGNNFTDPVTVSLIKDGGIVPNTTTNNASVSNVNTLTFTAPAVTNASMNTQNCVIGSGVTGVRFVPTSFGIRVINTRTGCTADLPNVLVYNPANGACSAALTISATALPTGAICSPYAASVSAGGGTPPYSFAATGTLPPGISMNSAGAFSGTPILGSGGPGGQQTYTFTVTVTDSASTTTSASKTIIISDPNGPFQITGNAFPTVPNTGGPTSTLTASPNPTPAGFTPVSWSILSVAPPTAGFTMTSATGQTSAVNVPAAAVAGVYNVTVQILDTICSGPAHSNTLVVTVSKNP